MKNISILAIDLAKHSFQVCATDENGEPIYNRKLSRAALKTLLTKQPPCIVAMEACGSSHYWGRYAQACGHDARLIPPIYVKPFVKRSKTDANDAFAIATAVRQPEMRFVSVKSEDQQAHAVLFRSHQMLTRQRAQLQVALRSYLAEFGIVIAKGLGPLKVFEARLEEETDLVPQLVLDMARLYFYQIHELSRSIESLDRQIKGIVNQDETARRLQTMPGVGPVISAAFMAFAPPMETFRKGRDFAAWLGLVPRQHSSGGKVKLGRMSKMGQFDIRRLLVNGAMSRLRWAITHGVPDDSWLGRMLKRKPRKMVAIALANKMARGLWAMIIRGEDYKHMSHANA